MLVLMDMEWIENKRHFFCPTQISAMRVDDRWNCVGRFDALIKPFDSSCRQWDHIAYSGAEPEAFLSADQGPLVFINLYSFSCALLHDAAHLLWAVSVLLRHFLQGGFPVMGLKEAESGEK